MSYDPVIDGQFGHRKVFGVSSRQPRPDTDGRGGDQTVSLMQCDASGCVLSPPRSCPHPLGQAQRGQSKPAEEPLDGCFFRPSYSSPNLFDGDDAHPWFDPATSQSSNPVGRWSTPHRVNEDGRVEHQSRHRSAGSTNVGRSLLTNPAGRIGVPLMAAVTHSAERRLDIVPSPLVIETALDQLLDHHAATPAAGPPVKFSDDSVVQRYVYPHGPRLAHRLVIPAAPPRRPPPSCEGQCPAQ